MATAGSAKRPGRPASGAAGKYRAGSGSGVSPPDSEAMRCSVCAEGRPGGGSPPCGQPACPLRRAHRLSGGEERLRRRSDPERSSSRPRRRDGDSRREFFVSPALVPKCPDAPTAAKHKGVLSDSENEEPISRRIRNISAFIRKTKSSAAFASGSQRSQSCSDPVDRGGKLKGGTLQGISHSSTAGILLSSENSRSVSAPITAPDRRCGWRAVVSPSSGPPVAAPRPERSISPESNDSISEELNHFKPIVCSPCTPPKRLPDGRLVEPTIVKSTPRNLTRGLQKATSYEASPAVLQKWRQIELDRQSLRVNSRATLTSPVGEPRQEEGAAKTRDSAAPAVNKRRLLFEPPAGDADAFQKQSVKIWVPAIRYSSEAALKGGSDFEPPAGAPESGSGAAFSRKRSFSPYARSCKLVPKDSQSPRKESDSSLHNQSTSRRGKKRDQKTKHLNSELDPDPKRSRPAGQDAFDERYVRQIQQERQDRALALKLQRQFDLEHQAGGRRRSPDAYFLRSWMSNQNRRRRGLRRSRRISKKH